MTAFRDQMEGGAGPDAFRLLDDEGRLPAIEHPYALLGELR